MVADIGAESLARKALPLSSKKVFFVISSTKLISTQKSRFVIRNFTHIFQVESYMKHSKMEEMLLELPSCYSPACRSPQSPKVPCMLMSWEDDYFSDLMMIDTPKLK